MKKMIFVLLSVIASASFAGDAHTKRPGVQMVVMDESLEQFAPLWQREVGRRFPNAVAVLCHGGDLVEGEWIVKSPDGNHELVRAADLMRSVKSKYPGRVIVLLACNPGHLTLGVPGVYYSNSSVWCVPDREQVSNQQARYLTLDNRNYLGTGDRSSDEPEIVGNIFEFDRD